MIFKLPAKNNMLKVFSKREKAILFLTIGVIVFSVLFNIVIAPFLTKNETLNKEIRITRAKLRQYVRLLSHKESLEKKFSKLSVSLTQSGSIENEPLGILSQIEELAKNSNIQITDIRPQTSRTVSGYKDNFVELRTEGDMESYLKLLYNIENSLSLMKVEKFHLKLKPNSALLEGSLLVSQIQLD